MSLITQVLDRVAAAADAAFGEKPENIKIGFPPNIEMGDFAVECFPFAKQFRKSPTVIAADIADRLKSDDLIQGAAAAGPYVNLTLFSHRFFGAVCKDLSEHRMAKSSLDAPAGRRIMVEYLSPNTNKPLHLGHIRNGALGMAISNLYESVGHTVVKANLINDRGVHICKSMLAWQKYGNGTTPETEGMKGDAFVGKWYVRFAEEVQADESLESEAQAMLKRWEEGDPATVEIWEKMNQWVYDGFSKTYETLGLKFDAFYYESQTYQHGKGIIDDGLEKAVFEKDARGNTVFSLPVESFGMDENGAGKRITVLRPDGTSLYITQDIGATVLKVSDHDLDRCIYVVGSEQQYHFQCLFAILKALGYPWADYCRHLSYGMVYLPEGKMKSREGKVVDADDLLARMTEMAAQEVRLRDPDAALDAAEVARRAEKIGTGAVKFYLLRVKPTQDIHFDPQESISFDGFTGPYCQYAYARICGIVRKAQALGIDAEKVSFDSLGNPEERALAQQLIRLPEAVDRAAREFNPSFVATYVFNTAKLFNQFYNKHSVIKADAPALQNDRLALIQATAQVIKKGLKLMNIEVLERM